VGSHPLGCQDTLKGPSQVRVPFNAFLAPNGGRQCARATVSAAAPHKCILSAKDSPNHASLRVVLALTAASHPGERAPKGTPAGEIP
jgi:hypothetical protein